ncbi:fasciclin domain-containing protein [Larkinella rosea]|uniref:Fasciclin domain-containing protein n=1 Tax=Larkinella rosea TaxID=2025312 RepID=A0A3P1BDG9_9BACT|nr:fasciclin domain-containing protein [Larkinella rosea]RRA98961.1 fasciclin domain-containing protein [Larkinella rosea]
MKKTRFSPFQSRTVLLAVFVTLFTFATSCDNEKEDAPAQPKTVADYVSENSDFSILKAAMLQAGQLDAFKNPNLTVFAPNDAAFRASGVTDATSLTALTKEQLTGILQYHVLKAAVASSGFPMEKNKAVQTSLSINNQAVLAYITNGTSGLFINGAKVTKPDVQVANGVIHVIDHILLPPPTGSGGSLVGVVQADTSLSLLGAAALRIATVNPTLAGVLTGTSPYTTFAPTNSAFRALKLSTADTINKVPVAMLTAILANHVVSGRLYSNDLTTGDVTAYSTGKLTVNSTGSAVTVKSNGIAAPATVTRANVTATNGVVHKIDKVLL